MNQSHITFDKIFDKLSQRISAILTSIINSLYGNNIGIVNEVIFIHRKNNNNYINEWNDSNDWFLLTFVNYYVLYLFMD